MAIEYKLVLTGDNETPAVADVELPFSSMSYSISNAPTASISATIEGSEYSSAIAARANGDLEFYYKASSDGDYILLAYGALTKITISETPRRYYITIEGLEESYPLFTADDNIEMDDITSSYTLEDGAAKFVTPVVGQYYVPGAVVEYDSIEYGIGDVSFSMGGGGAPSWTLTEGEVEVTTTSGTAYDCAFDLESGVQISDRMVWSDGGALGEYDNCYRINDRLGGIPYGCRTGWVYWEYQYPVAAGQTVYIRFYHFDLAAESNVTLKITSADFFDMETYEFDIADTPLTYHVCNGETLSRGFVAILSLGEKNYGDELKQVGSSQWGSYTNSVDNPFGGEVTRFYANTEKALTLPAGSYTLSLMYIGAFYISGTQIDYTIDYEATVA